MQIEKLIIPPKDLPYAVDVAGPLAFIDLDACPADARIEKLSQCPLIGLGGRAHPLAPMLDAVIEAPVTAEAIIRQVERAPKAAAIAVQLLRSLDGLEPRRALTLESMAYGLLQGSAEHQAWLAARAPARKATPAGQVHVTRRGDVMSVVMDRPEARNAIDRRMRDGLSDAFAFANFDRHIRAVQVRATGEAFSIGGDLDEFGTTRDPATAHQIRGYTLPALPLVDCAKIVDVHVQGACIGAGIEIAAFAGRVTATERAWFQLPELAMGLIPGAGGCVSLPRRIGRQRAVLMLLSGKRISAKTALDWGLIDAIEDAR